MSTSDDHRDRHRPSRSERVDAAPILRAHTLIPAQDLEVHGGFVSINGERFAMIADVDAMAPFLMSIASDSDVWLFVASNGAFTAGRRDPDHAMFPNQTADRFLRDATAGGVRTSFLVSRGGPVQLWEPWREPAGTRSLKRNLYKRIDGTAVIFEEVDADLGLRFRWSLSACEEFGLVRHAVVEEITGEAVDVRYLDGWHQMMPAGVDRDVYARLSYLAIAYMRHERVADSPLAIYTLNTVISDRPEPAESLRVTTAWTLGHSDPTFLLSEAQVETFRRGGQVESEAEVRGEMGAYLAVDSVSLGPKGSHGWHTVADTGLDHRAVLELRRWLRSPDELRSTLQAAVIADRRGVQLRVAGADGIQSTADEAATANHAANTLFNVMRGGSFERGYELPRADLQSYLEDQNPAVRRHHQQWLEELPDQIRLDVLLIEAEQQDDAQLMRLLHGYLPLTFSRRHGDPSRPWNWYSIRVHDARGDPVYGYEGNWRDIFQNWEALGVSYPGYLPQFISVFLNASTADGYNPYRITRKGIDWEVEDPDDPWSHIGYWGDHQIIYLVRLLEAYERHQPGALRAGLAERIYSYADVPYRIGGFEDIVADPRHTITFDRARHELLLESGREQGADGRLVRDDDGQVRLVSLAEKLLVPLLVKLTNLVPGSGIWLNTQRPEWNDANNALAGWGLSVVTLNAMVRYATLLLEVFSEEAEVELAASVRGLSDELLDILESVQLPLDDEARYATMAQLGLAGERHRQAVYAGTLGEAVSTPHATIRTLLHSASRLIGATLRASRRPDGLFHSYDMLQIDGQRARIKHLGLMLEGQVAVLDSGLLDDGASVELLRALRASDLYRADQHSYLLYPDRPSVPFLQRNTIAGDPPLTDAALFVIDGAGAWHFQADLSTLGDVDARLEAIGAEPAIRDGVRDLWRETFGHDEFTGRSDRFFMFEGLGSIYWHMVAKLAVAVQWCHGRATDPTAADTLAAIYHDIRDGLGFRKDAALQGAFPTDPYSHTPGHLGAQQPGMTGQVKEQVLTRFGELGVEVTGGCVRFAPRLLARSELVDAPADATFRALGGKSLSIDLAPGSLAFTYCQVPIIYRLAGAAGIELERVDGRFERTDGLELDRTQSLTLFDRRGTYRRLNVTIPTDALYES